jgi:hypothetical protein
VLSYNAVTSKKKARKLTDEKIHLTEKEQLEFEEVEMLAIIEKAREIYANDVTDPTERN